MCKTPNIINPGQRPTIFLPKPSQLQISNSAPEPSNLSPNSYGRGALIVLGRPLGTSEVGGADLWPPRVEQTDDVQRFTGLVMRFLKRWRCCDYTTNGPTLTIPGP